MKIIFKNKKKLKIGGVFLLSAFCLFLIWQIYIPKSFGQSPSVVYIAKKGLGYKEISKDLSGIGIIKNSFFFKFYVALSGKYGKLQAGRYNLSSSMSIAKIVKKFVMGEVIKDEITIIEGWNLKDIADYLESRNLYSKEDFLSFADSDFAGNFEILKDKPNGLGLEGYIFPDTYEVSVGQTAGDLVGGILLNLDKKITPDLKQEIKLQKKSIFQIITMASILEKEVKSIEDKKIVSGILWKRLESGVPLQIDSTINYITSKNDAKVTIRDTKIDSPYNTYKYQGLPLGPISNPGMESILAAIYPKNSSYWYYLSADHTGKTIFSKTLYEHNTAIAKYFN